MTEKKHAYEITHTKDPHLKKRLLESFEEHDELFRELSEL